jgi:hypothetical protein
LVPSIRGIIHWNERQLLADQATLIFSDHDT